MRWPEALDRADTPGAALVSVAVVVAALEPCACLTRTENAQPCLSPYSAVFGSLEHRVRFVGVTQKAQLLSPTSGDSQESETSSQLSEPPAVWSASFLG